MNKTIVITGAGKGIGKAVALKFAAQGYDVAICARTEKHMQELKSEIQRLNQNATVLAVKCDVRNRADLKNFADKVLKQFGAVDIIVNNAGTFVPGQVYNEPDGNLETIIETNLYSAYYLSRWLLPPMIAEKRGYVFNLCSVASIKAYSNGGSYGISKHALLGFSKNLREEMKPFNIKVTALIPGATYTDSWSASGLPEERFMKAGDIADIIWDITNLSPGAVVEEILLRPILGDI